MRTHLCIFKPEYLGLILCEVKTIECRITKVACPPFNCVSAADILWLKQSSGPIRGEAQVARVEYFHPLTVRKLRRMRRSYNNRICGSPTFWRSRHNHPYATLIWLREVRPVWPVRHVEKTDPRGWVVLQ